MIVGSFDYEISEVCLIFVVDLLVVLILVCVCEKGVEYDVDECDGMFYIYINDVYENFCFVIVLLEWLGEWMMLIEGIDEFYFIGFELFCDFYVIEGCLI